MLLLALTAIEILNLVATAEEAQQNSRCHYVYREEQENWRLDSYGRVIENSRRVKAFEVIFVQGQRYRKLVERDGKPLSAAEAWAVEEDLRREEKTMASTASLRDLARTHRIHFHGSVLLATGETSSYEFSFDPATHNVVEQRILKPNAKVTLNFIRMPDGTYLPGRIITEFTIGDVNGLQVSTFSNHRKIEVNE